MDEKDFEILVRLRENPFQSFEALGRTLGLSGTAVKTRIGALEDVGILPLLQAQPTARVFGRTPRLFLFERPTTIEELRAALDVDPAVFATLDVDHHPALLLYAERADGGLPAALSKSLGIPELAVTPMFPRPGPAPGRPVSVADLKVLRVLVGGLRTPIHEISESTHLSPKVVRRTRAHLLEEGLLRIQPIVRSARSGRLLLFELHIFSPDEGVLQTVRTQVPRSAFLNQWPGSALILSCWAESMVEVSETVRQLESTPGVEHVRVKFHAETLFASERLLGWIDAAIDQRRRGTPSAG